MNLEHPRASNVDTWSISRTRRVLRTLSLGVLLVLVVGLLAACGGDDDDATPTSASDGAATAMGTGNDATATTAAVSTPDAATQEPTGASTAAVTTPSAAATSPGGATGTLTDVSLALDWYPWSNHAGILLALQNGFFEDEGLNVEVYVPSDPTTALGLVAAGQDDFTISYQADVLLAREQDLEVVSVAALVQHPLNTIMTLQSSGITEPKQLDGTKIGVTGVPSDDAMVAAVLESVGLSLDDVELISVGFDLMPALLSKQVDAIIGGYYVHEAILAEQQGAPVNAIYVQEHGVPDYYELLLVTNDDMVDDDPDTVAAFVRALQRGYAAVEDNPDAGVDAIMAAYPETAEEVEREGIPLVIPYWTSDGTVAWGTQTAERWESYAAWLVEQGLLEDTDEVEDAFTSQFVQ